jgi:hypothetical protein
MTCKACMSVKYCSASCQHKRENGVGLTMMFGYRRRLQDTGEEPGRGKVWRGWREGCFLSCRPYRLEVLTWALRSCWWKTA